MNSLDKTYQGLLRDILDNGIQKSDRTGTGTLSIFGRQIRHKMSEGFPVLTTKKMAWNSIVIELLWFLRGDTNIKYLVENDCHIWNGDAFKNYYRNSDRLIGNWPDTQEEFIQRIKTDDQFARKWGELGPIYGAQWRGWFYGTWWSDTTQSTVKKNYIDQISNLINDLKTNPDSRRLMVSAWNVGELDQMVLPPCHYGFQMYTVQRDGQRYLSLMWNQRSVDTFLGLPFNIASYGLLLEIIAKEVNMVPNELIGNLGDVHLYSNHIEQAEEQLNRTPFPLPTLQINKYRSDVDSILFDITKWSYVNFTIEDYQSHPAIKAPLSN